jgi:hypothetical protein
MRMFKCIDHNYPLKRWEMLYIHKKFHQIKLIIVANYEWGITKLKIGKDETHYKLLFYQGKGGREIFFIFFAANSWNCEDP